MNFIIFPKLFTERLILRKLEVEDLPYLARYANNRKVTDHIVNFPFPYTDIHASMRLPYIMDGFKKDLRYVFAIEEKSSSHFIGEIAIHYTNDDKDEVQIAYWLGEPFWNQGYMSECLDSLVTFISGKLSCNAIIADCKKSNEASARVLIKAGFELVNESDFLLIFKKQIVS